MRRFGPGVVAATAVTILAAQSQTTFYAAFTEARESMRQRQWRAAIGALERAIELRPTPASRVLTYGNNLLFNYHPYSLLARCRLELGEAEAAAALLKIAEAKGEPASALEPVARRLPRLAESVPSQVHDTPLPEPLAPAKRPETPPPAPEPPPQAHPAAVLPEPPGLPASPLPGPEETAAAAPAREKGATPAPRGPSNPARIQVRPELPSPAPPRGPEPVRPLPPGFWISALAVLASLTGWTAWKRRRPARLAPEPAASRSRTGPAAVGPYRIMHTLGHGGFATTYLARHRESGREVALKVMHPHRLQDPEFRRRFRQEAKLGALLEHPHLVRLLDPGADDDSGWIALEYVAGPTLEARLKACARLPLEEALDIALGIAEAMAYAHARGVVHRDLKPANVILSAQGAKVLDLGVARDLGASGATTTYAFIGTPLYAAPETQLMAKVGPAADRYSLGVMMFEMLAGSPPFQGETPFATMDLHRSAPVPDLGAVREVPPALARLIGNLMDKDPARRPGDAELLEQLRPFQGFPMDALR